jgi:hypothetical protein
MSAHNVSRDPWATAGPAPLYLPNLIAALVASAGIVIGSLGPWLTFLVFDRSNTDRDGKYTLVAGILATAALFVVGILGRSRPVKTERMARLCRVPIVMGVLTFVVGAIDAHEVLSRHVELFGQTLGPQIGWGLWMVLIMSVVLVVTASVLARQSRKLADDDDDDELVASWRDKPVPPRQALSQPVEETVEETTRVRCVGCGHVQSVPVSLRSFECEQCGKQLQRKAASS